MIHIDNISHVLQHGITHSKSKNKNIEYQSIGDNTLISTRRDKEIEVTSQKDNYKITLGDYIPFYFGIRMPMLYVIQKGYNGVKRQPPEKIIYCVCSVQKVIELSLPFVFTDGHATDGFSLCYSSDYISNIEKLVNFEAVSAKNWTVARDMKRQKEAEFLIKDDIPFAAIIGFAVYNDKAQKELEKLGVSNKMIGVRKEFYF